MLTKIKNYLLIKKFPFLKPRNVWTGLPAEKYDYSWTWFDDIPCGWRKAFGMQMCQEIKDALLDAQDRNPKGGYEEKYITTKYDSDKIIPYLYGYQIVQIKEKYGELRWYDNGGPGRIDKIIDKYTDLSCHTCIMCGEKATKVSTGWISPYCDECAKKIKNEVFEEIEENE